jgi:hypothetical protein
MQANAGKSAETGPGPEKEQDKEQRQALYLAYRAMTVDEQGRRMTQAAAAKLAGVSSDSVSRWKRESEQFRAKEQEAREYGVGQARKLAKSGVWSLLGTAIYQLASLLRDKETPPQVKASIGLKMLEYAGAAEPVEIEVSGDPWGALLKRLAEDETDEG